MAKKKLAAADVLSASFSRPLFFNYKGPNSSKVHNERERKNGIYARSRSIDSFYVLQVDLSYIYIHLLAS